MQKFNERLDLEKRGAMVVWGKNKEVAEPNRNGRVDWQRAGMQPPHIIRETETIEVVERIIQAILQIILNLIIRRISFQP